MGEKSKKTMKQFAWRLVRGVVALGISSATAYVSSEPTLIWLTPVLSGIGKFVRSQWEINWLPI